MNNVKLTNPENCVLFTTMIKEWICKNHKQTAIENEDNSAALQYNLCLFIIRII